MKLVIGFVFTVFLSTCVQASENSVSRYVDSELRSEKNVARDIYRHPAETLTFFGIKENDHVLEMWPGNGWYTEILAPYLSEEGQLSTATYLIDQLNSKDKRDAYRTKTSLKFQQQFSDKYKYGDILFYQYCPETKPKIELKEPADAALLVRLLHVWDEIGKLQQGLTSVFDALRSGGILGIVQHRSDPVSDMASVAVEGYLDQDYVIEAAQKAGFQLVATSEINANLKDTKDYPKGVYALPPTLAMGKKDRAKYLAIGESDRMTLKFIKP